MQNNSTNAVENRSFSCQRDPSGFIQCAEIKPGFVRQNGRPVVWIKGI